jgi:hypothetical protein
MSELHTIATIYGFKLNPRESWAVIEKLNESGVRERNIGQYISILQQDLHQYMSSFQNVSVSFLSDRPLYNESQIQITEPFSIVFGAHMKNGSTIAEIEALRYAVLMDVRLLRRFFREIYNLRLDFTTTDGRLFYGHVIPHISIGSTFSSTHY